MADLANEFLRCSVDSGYRSSERMERDQWFPAVQAAPELGHISETVKRCDAEARADFISAMEMRDCAISAWALDGRSVLGEI
jgi:hypothetical protein